MKKLLRPVSWLLSFTMTFAVVMSLFSFEVAAKDNSVDVSGLYYEFDDSSTYNISSATPTYTMDHTSLGSVSVTGNINKTSTMGKIPAYEIADGELFSIKFSYDDTLKSAGEKEWHLYKDSKKEVDGVTLDSKIDLGAILLQTSFDDEHWVTINKQTNISGDVRFDDKECINDIQLLNGCYYRVVVAYEVQMKIDPIGINFAFWETPLGIPDNDYMKNAEVYEFYAGYKSAGEEASDNIETLEIGRTQAVTVDNGFVKNINMDSDDPHLGWDLGRFVVGGFTKNQKNASGDTVFLKNVGDKITLWFNMDKRVDIDKLNGKDTLSIHSDTNGYDSALNVPPQNFKRGTLIVRFTDYKGKTHDPIIYTNFLEALASPGADTKIQLFEEGDYEVSLDYEILNSKGVDKLYNYKIAFNFQIRNGNTVVYPKDKATGAYLANDSVTENGFVLDWAKSRYLNINVELSQWTKGANGYTEDTIFNRPAKESDEYTKTGIYTITVTNPTTDPYGNNPTVKKIYVGSDNVLIASMNAKNASYTINEIYNLQKNEGYEITDKGELIPPVTTEPPVETTSAVIEETTSQSTSTTTQVTETSSTTEYTTQGTTSTTSTVTTSNVKEDKTDDKKSPVPFIGIGSAVLIAVVAVIGGRQKRNS